MTKRLSSHVYHNCHFRPHRVGDRPFLPRLFKNHPHPYPFLKIHPNQPISLGQFPDFPSVTPTSSEREKFYFISIVCTCSVVIFSATDNFGNPANLTKINSAAKHHFCKCHPSKFNKFSKCSKFIAFNTTDTNSPPVCTPLTTSSENVVKLLHIANEKSSGGAITPLRCYVRSTQPPSTSH